MNFIISSMLGKHQISQIFPFKSKNYFYSISLNSVSSSAGSFNSSFHGETLSAIGVSEI